MRKYSLRKIIIYILIMIVILIIILPSSLNLIRYKFESMFGDPNSFFYSVGLGIDTDGFQYYEEQYDLDEYLNKLTIDPYYLHEGELTIYGSVRNSPEPLKIIVNEEVIHSGKMSWGSSDSVWDESYLDRYFAIRLENLIENQDNEILLISGSAVEKITIGFK